MRPLRLELVGFSAFRDRTEVDFDGVDLFAFVGPTGAGKSSLIDAMVFALYGSVPRYDNANLVHPVITQGAVEARVRLDFEVADEHYSATRVVVRTKTGATTKEARLEHGNVVLADDAKGMTAAVADLLGLDLGQFTKCVVLPQGAFATLLHDAKADRQKLLVKLLDLGLYSQVAALARARAKEADGRIGLLDEQLTALDGADDAIATAEARRDRLTSLIDQIDSATPGLAEAAKTIADAETERRELSSLRSALSAVKAPTGIVALAESVDGAAAKLAQAEAVEARASERVTAAADAREGLGDPSAIRSRRQVWDRLDELEARVAKGTEVVAAAQAELVPLETAVTEVDEVLAAASSALEAARLSDAAAGVAALLRVGDDCPVCGHEVHDLVHHDEGDVAAATQTHAGAADAARLARDAHSTAERHLIALRSKLDDRIAERDSAKAAVADAPAPSELDDALAAIETAEADLKSARAADTTAREAVRKARDAHKTTEAALAQVRADYNTARDAVAAAGPPASTEDLAADWAALIDWAIDTETSAAAAEKQAEERRLTAEAEHRRITDELLGAATEAGVAVAEATRVRDRCVEAHANSAAEVNRLTTERDRLGAVAATRAELAQQRDVHDLLSRELGARGFEAWLLDEALELLLEGASTWLEQLSSGRYALAVDDKHTFVVVDHANADERRLARTLSGGETFLASLALALALAERITELSATGGRRLDAIFLDEGFGTLDADTLDVVATAIEELGATGRMVGIISHVPELAERVPVRFAVTRGATSSTVERQER